MPRRVASLCAACLACALITSCSAPPAAPSSPDPFSTVAAQADQAYQQGLTLYKEGHLPEALNAFQRARLLSPSDDPRIDAMTKRVAAELTPTATPAPPTSTPATAPTPIVQNPATPSAELGQEYFGQVFLTIVPGRDSVPPALTQFSAQDQIGLYIEKLDQRLHLAFELRIFEVSSGRLVAESTSDSVQTVGAMSTPATIASAAPVGTPRPDVVQHGIVRFLDRFVWYHQGGDSAGTYRAELYAGDVLTHTFDYAVGSAPVAIPTDTPAPAPAPQPAAVVVEGPAATPAPVTAPASSAPRPAQAPALVRAPTATEPPPTPLSATALAIPGGPAAVEAPDSSDQMYVADRSGLVWSLDHAQPTLKRPFTVWGVPAGLASDAATGRVYVAVGLPRGAQRSAGRQPALLMLDAATGQQVASVPLPGDPGDIRLDSTLGLLFVVVPDRETLETIDVRDPKILRSTDGLAQVTGIALDQDTHTLYLSQLDGQLAVVDGQTGVISDHLTLSGVGLAGVAVGGGRVYAINTPGQALLAVDPATGDVLDLPLGTEPAALVIGPQSGAACILEPAVGAVVRLDPGSGIELGRVSLGQDPVESPSLAPDDLWARPRLAISPMDETVYVIEPQSGTLALVPAPP